MFLTSYLKVCTLYLLIYLFQIHYFFKLILKDVSYANQQDIFVQKHKIVILWNIITV